MTFYAFAALLNGVTSLALGAFVILKNKRGIVNRSYGFTTIAISCWSFAYFFWQISTREAGALLWCRVLMVGAIFISPTYLHFAASFLGLQREQKKPIVLGYLLAIVFFLLNFTPLFVKGVSPKLGFRWWPDAGVGYLPFLFLYAYCLAYAIAILFREQARSMGLRRAQIRYVILGALLGFGGGATNYPLWYNIRILPVGNIFVSAGIAVMAYAVVKYRLMDVNVAVTRTGIFVAVYTLVLGLPFLVAVWFKDWLTGVSGEGWWVYPLALMAVLATSGPFIYIYLERKAEARLLKNQRRYQQTLKEASLGMTRIRDLRRLLDLIAHIITKTVKISYVAIYLHDIDSDQYLLQVSRDKGRQSLPKLAADNPLVVWLAYKREPLIYDEVKRKSHDLPSELYKDLEENMRALTASVIIPSFLEDKFMGFILLGDKLSGEIYTPDDLNVFQVLANQAALAIENAQFYDETKQMQEQVAKAEKMATIGTMADGLSHQINNRLYALGLIAGDTIDTIKMTDTTTCSSEIREMIAQISKALDRIQVNVTQGGEVVKGLLKYTRSDQGGIEPVALATVLDQALEMVQYKVKLSEIDIIRDFPPDVPMIHGNLVQLEEVFFNLIDNAYDAIVERRSTLAEPGYRGKITIAAQPINGKLEITLQDNGMGVKDSNHTKIFTPFFTTKTSSRKGTGLGLYVIHRIIEDHHKGTITFESEHGVGTRFVIQVSIAS